jgi:hypothetical protein
MLCAPEVRLPEALAYREADSCALSATLAEHHALEMAASMLATEHNRAKDEASGFFRLDER